jgi:hypothetical protein
MLSSLCSLIPGIYEYDGRFSSVQGSLITFVNSSTRRGRRRSGFKPPPLGLEIRMLILCAMLRYAFYASSTRCITVLPRYVRCFISLHYESSPLVKLGSNQRALRFILQKVKCGLPGLPQTPESFDDQDYLRQVPICPPKRGPRG